MLQTAQFQLCSELPAPEHSRMHFPPAAQSPGSEALEGSRHLPWPGRRFQHLLGIEESHAPERDQSTNPKQGFKRGLVESRIMMGRI